MKSWSKSSKSSSGFYTNS